MNKLLLNIIRWFSPLWRTLGAEPIQLLAILQTRLVMDSRRATVFSQGRSTQNAELKNQDWLAMGVFFMMGLFMMALFFAFEQTTTTLAIYFMVWMFMLAMTLISDFTDVLIDVRDNYILFPRPVSDRTITLSRILHIGIYLSKLTLAFALPAFIFMLIAKFPWGGPIFLFQLFLSLVISIFAVNLIYLFLLRFTTARKFKEIISYFQIAFSILILGSYYLLPRLVDLSVLKDVEVYEVPILQFLPSTWIAALWGILGEGDYRALSLVLGTLAIVMPLVALFLITEVLAKHFNRKMMAMAEGSSTNDAKFQEKAEKPRTGIMPWLAQKACISSTERAGFELTWLLSKRSRDFKLKSYPSMAFVIVFFFYYLLQGDGSLAERLSAASGGKWYILLVYLAWISFSTFLHNSRFANKFKSSWIYLSVPVKKPGPILTGAFKAIFFRFYLPFFVFILVASLPVWGWGIIDDFLFGMLNTLCLSLISHLLAGQHRLPFSDSWANQSKGGNLAVNILMLFLIGLIGGAHYFLTNLGWVVGALCVPMVIILALLLRSYQRVPWSKIRWAGF